MYACTTSPAEASESVATTLRIRILPLPAGYSAGGRAAVNFWLPRAAMELPRESAPRGLKEKRAKLIYGAMLGQIELGNQCFPLQVSTGTENADFRVGFHRFSQLDSHLLVVAILLEPLLDPTREDHGLAPTWRSRPSFRRRCPVERVLVPSGAARSSSGRRLAVEHDGSVPGAWRHTNIRVRNGQYYVERKGALGQDRQQRGQSWVERMSREVDGTFDEALLFAGVRGYECLIQFWLSPEGRQPEL